MLRSGLYIIKYVWLGMICISLSISIQVVGQNRNAEYMHIATVADTAGINSDIRKGKQLKHVKPDSAIIWYKKALLESEQAAYSSGMGNASKELLEIYSAKGMYDSAMYMLKTTALKCMLSQPLRRTLPPVLNNIGNVYSVWNDHENATKYYLNAALTAEKLGDYAPLRYIHLNLANVLCYFHQYKQALVYINSAEKYCIKYNDYFCLGDVLNNKGTIYSKDSNDDGCLIYYEQALDIGVKYGFPRLEHAALTNIGNYYLDNNMPKKALNYLLKTQDIHKDVDPFYAIISSINLARVYIALRNFNKAEPILLRALDTATRLNIRQWITNAEEQLAHLYSATGKYELAYKHHVAFAILRDSSYFQGISQSVNQMETKYRIAQKDKLIAENALHIARQENNIKKQNYLITIISFGTLLITILLISLYRSNQHRRRAQQKEIYILKQEQKIGQLQAMMVGEEKERTRLAQELHDGIGGMLAVIKMNINKVKKLYPELVHIRPVSEIMSMVLDTAAQVRRTAHNLMPDVLLKNSLAESLMLYCDTISNDNHLQIDLQFNGTFDKLDKRIELVLYRIIQELLQNTIKHADATQVVIQFMQYNEKLSITVEDNGVGFDVAKTSNGLGLQNMQLRVEALNGHISIQSANSRGTTIYIEFALSDLKSIHSFNTADKAAI